MFATTMNNIKLKSANENVNPHIPFNLYQSFRLGVVVAALFSLMSVANQFINEGFGWIVGINLFSTIVVPLLILDFASRDLRTTLLKNETFFFSVLRYLGCIVPFAIVFSPTMESMLSVFQFVFAAQASWSLKLLLNSGRDKNPASKIMAYLSIGGSAFALLSVAVAAFF